MKTIITVIGDKSYSAQIPTPEEIGKMTEHEFFSLCEKINIPDSLESYQNGNGEGVWAMGDKNFIKDYKTNARGTKHVVQLYNKSVYYPALDYNAVVVVEMRGNNRPVVIYDQLAHLECIW